MHKQYKLKVELLRYANFIKIINLTIKMTKNDSWHLVSECHDDVAQIGQTRVDGFGFLEAGALRPGVLQPFTACQVHQVKVTCNSQHNQRSKSGHTHATDYRSMYKDKST